MDITASDFYTYLSPSRCARRLYLRHAGATEGPESPYVEVIKKLGLRHERAHLATLLDVTDLSGLSMGDRIAQTIELVESLAPVIYQPAIEATIQIEGTDTHLVGNPDFFVLEESGYAIRDSKMSRRLDKKDHPEIHAQLNLYGLLFERTFRTAPARLQVHSGAGAIVDIPYAPDIAVEEIAVLQAIKHSEAEPFAAVGWSKCTGCPFHDHCWTEAEQSQAVARVYGVDEGLADALHERGIDTIEQFLSSFTEGTLAVFERPWGSRTQRVGKKAGEILEMAESLLSGAKKVRKPPQIPDYQNYVMFDLEGLPPQLDELDKVYLWGMQVCGDKPSSFLPAVAGFGAEGELQGWQQFLRLAQNIFNEYGDISFVHWAAYEPTHIKGAIKRYGDPDGIGQRVLNNLVDLLPITRDSVVLPLHSYSLKQVEKYVGFERTQDEYGGDWSIAKFIEATETEDEAVRNELMDGILKYNEEDLAATWAVLTWLKSLRP